MKKEIKDRILRAEQLDWKILQPFQPENLKIMTKESFDILKANIIERNFLTTFAAWQDKEGIYWIIDGHHRKYALEALEKEGYKMPKKFMCYIVDCKDKLDANYVLLSHASAHAKIDELGFAEFISVNEMKYENLKATLEIPGVDFDRMMNDTFNDSGEIGENNKGSLSDKFLVPPFSILDSRQGYWLDRKRYWVGIGIKSEMGRGDNSLGFGAACNEQMNGSHVYKDREKSKNFGRTFGHGLTSSNYGKCLETGSGAQYGREEMTGTSIFDPVLCELAYRWFSPAGGIVVDPFAGGSVRGIVAAKCGRQYIGVDLRAEQVEANRMQWETIGRMEELAPVWHTGDSRNILKIASGVEADLIFTCPPYADLEVYSDDPQDISTLNYKEFIAAYKQIILESCNILKTNRFACIVVGDIRDKKGIYRNFVSNTIDAFCDAGLSYYNEAILITAIGSLPIRAGKQFTASRKLGKTHQNVLVFVKGDPKLATAACGEVKVYCPEEAESESESEVL